MGECPVCHDVRRVMVIGIDLDNPSPLSWSEEDCPRCKEKNKMSNKLTVEIYNIDFQAEPSAKADLKAYRKALREMPPEIQEPIRKLEEYMTSWIFVEAKEPTSYMQAQLMAAEVVSRLIYKGYINAV